MSENYTDGMGNALPTSPPTTNRRAGWIIEARNIHNPAINAGKYWKQKKADLIRECEGILDRVAVEGRELTDGERKWFDATKTDVDYVNGVIEQLDSAERSRQSQAGLLPGSSGTGYAMPGNGYPTPGSGFSGADDDNRNLRLLQRVAFRGRHFAELFGNMPQEAHQFRSFDEFLGIISHNQFDPRLMHVAASGMNETIGSEGAFLIPTEYASRLLDSALEQSVLWGRVRVEPMNTNRKVVSSFANESNANATGQTANAPFGLTLQWLDEGAPFVESKAAVRSITLNANKAGIYVPFTRELSEDGGESFSKQLLDATGQALAWGIDDGIINGGGSGRLLGVIASPSTIVVPKESGQAANTYTFQNAVDQYSRMHPACVPNSIWLANPSVMPQLLTMSIALGASGQWYPATTETSGVYSLLGRPLFLSEKCSTLGTKGDVIFLDPSQYVLGLRRGITAALSEHVKFASDEIVLRITARLDGMPAWSKAYTPKNGPTTSWATVTATRA